MEKRVLLWLLMTLAILFLWGRFFAPPPPKKTPKPGPATGTVENGGAPNDGAPNGDTPNGDTPESPDTPEEKPEPAPPPAVKAPEEGAFEKRERTDPIRTPTVSWTLTSWGGAIEQAKLERYSIRAEQDLSDPAHWYPVFSDVFGKASREYTPRPLSLDILTRGGAWIRTSMRNWTLATRDDAARLVSYTLDLTDEAGVAFTKEFRFPTKVDGVDAYHAEVTVRMTVTDPDRAKTIGDKGLKVRLVGPAGITGEPKSSLGTVLESEILTTGRVDAKEVSGPLDVKGPFRAEAWPEVSKVWPEEIGDEGFIKGFGVHTRYFGALLQPVNPEVLGARQVHFFGVRDDPLVVGDPDHPSAKDKEKEKEFGNHLTAVDIVLPLPAKGESVERSFRFFAGPMEPKLLRNQPYDAFAPLVDYGWLGIPRLLLLLLGVIQSVVGNWGVAIIILTLLVRMAMFPVSRKSQVSMQKFQRQMARVKPKMDAIKEKYKSNKQKQQQELAKMMREEGMRPVPAGCLMMFIQLPIFIGLFQALRWSIDLRHAPFLWAADLTAPDQMFRISDGSMFLIPEYFNLFPVLMAITWFFSMAMAPKPVDPQQQSTMKMMKWMPIVFSVMLYNYAAGLSLYMVVSSSWSIFETKVVKKLLFKDEPAVATGVPAPEFRRGK